ncbi:hypothetical protein SS50377_23434 [Spironucleus salmonicida]|uniref:Uncharacterized protein n=1 Tax=Spironucleus salmonicida TaxID=348837 RepID=V6LR62_9EUKA|nr:hypothetical protein SS50377_23434 [Spironucleus salmonicida]|eukprot:EST46171.1 Hypothetical protein SS50377_13764 [Spironucleus salmonicida]
MEEILLSNQVIQLKCQHQDLLKNYQTQLTINERQRIELEQTNQRYLQQMILFEQTFAHDLELSTADKMDLVKSEIDILIEQKLQCYRQKAQQYCNQFKELCRNQEQSRIEQWNMLLQTQQVEKNTIFTQVEEIVLLDHSFQVQQIFVDQITISTQASDDLALILQTTVSQQELQLNESHKQYTESLVQSELVIAQLNQQIQELQIQKDQQLTIQQTQIQDLTNREMQLTKQLQSSVLTHQQETQLMLVQFQYLIAQKDIEIQSIQLGCTIHQQDMSLQQLIETSIENIEAGKYDEAQFQISKII